MASRSKQLISAARTNMPEGTWAVGAGLLVVGVTAYMFQIVAAHALSEANYAALNGLWVVVFVVAPGLFLPLEQEVGRALSERRALGTGGGPLVKRAALLGGMLAVGVILIACVFAPLLIDHLFDGYDLLFVCLLIGIVGYYLEGLARGTLSGNGRFSPYGLLIGTEGLVRAAFCIVLAVLGASNPEWYGFVLVLAPFVGVGVALAGQRGLLQPGPPAPYSELSTALGYLLAGSLLQQFLGYATFLTAVVLAPPGQASEDALGGFIAALFLARIPILLFQAIQAALLPKLAALHGEGRHEDFRTGLRRLMLIVGGVGAIGVIAAFTLGGTVGRLLFGADTFTISSTDLGLLATGSAIFIMATMISQALIALRDYVRAMLTWICGLSGFFAVVAAGAEITELNENLFLRVELAFIFGSLISLALNYWFVHRHVAAGDTGDIDPLYEVFEHERMEI